MKRRATQAIKEALEAQAVQTWEEADRNKEAALAEERKKAEKEKEEAVAAARAAVESEKSQEIERLHQQLEKDATSAAAAHKTAVEAKAREIKSLLRQVEILEFEKTVITGDWEQARAEKVEMSLNMQRGRARSWAPITGMTERAPTTTQPGEDEEEYNLQKRLEKIGQALKRCEQEGKDKEKAADVPEHPLGQAPKQQGEQSGGQQYYSRTIIINPVVININNVNRGGQVKQQRS
jgi:hypothetical protein